MWYVKYIMKHLFYDKNNTELFEEKNPEKPWRDMFQKNPVSSK